MPSDETKTRKTGLINKTLKNDLKRENKTNSPCQKTKSKYVQNIKLLVTC